jgi:DNA repair exonuclease SbcCD nuclease subunit
VKFAHLADTHLGRQRDGKLREIEKRIFQNTVDEILFSISRSFPSLCLPK